MIATVTLNPSLDYIVRVNEFREGLVNRTEAEQIFPGGKGINVALMLQRLGVSVCCFGFVAGFTGREIDRRLQEEGCQTEFLFLENGISRINIKLKTDQESEINGKGPVVSEEELYRLFLQLEQLQSGDTVVFAGSIPASLPQNIYELWIKRLSEKKLQIVVDATSESLMRVLPLQPFLIKPNHHELGELFGQILSSTEEIIDAAKKTQTLGAKNVLVSCAGKEAVLLTQTGEVFTGLPPKGTVVNSVASGDSMVAGFLSGYQRSQQYEEAFKWGLAAGSATAFSEWLGTADRVEALYQQL